ncbi:Integrator complex subunit 13 [Bulinus truncatus]|nr:Integrator complex subunit 13 [Bulinus truncatus]
MPTLLAIDHLEKSSRFWPLVISETILFNLQNMSQLPQLLVQDTLTDDQLLECTKLIYKVLEMEQKNDPLPVPATGSRGKGPKRDELYRQLWSELEALVRSYADTSDKHNKVLECLMNCKKPGDEKVTVTRKTPSKKEDKSGGGNMTDVEQSWKDLDRFQQMTTREKMDALQGEKNLDTPPPKKLKSEELLMRSGGQTLLNMWNNRLKTIYQKRSHEFDGRLDSPGDKAKLYIHLEENSIEQPNGQPMNVAKKMPTCSIYYAGCSVNKQHDKEIKQCLKYMHKKVF